MPAMHQAQIFHRDIYSVVRFRENYEISVDHVYLGINDEHQERKFNL